MKAMLFAAGRGTRLRPLTLGQPKALVEVQGRTLLEIAVERLKHAGFDEVIINVHHFAKQVIRFLEEKENFGIRIAISDESAKLLNTGGGLKRAAWFFRDSEQPFLVCNVDVITTLDLAGFYHSHCQTDAMATLAVRQRASLRRLLFDGTMRLAGWQDLSSGERRLCLDRETALLRPLAFSGIQVIHPMLLDYMPQAEVFSIIDWYLRAGATQVIRGHSHSEDYWLDAGSPETLAQAERDANKWVS